MLTGFVLLSGIWLATLLLSGLKQYKQIVALYALGYGIAVAAAISLRSLGLEGLLLGFVLGHFVMLLGMVLLVARGFPSTRFIAYDFAQRGRMYPSLIWGGLLYNLAIWADKIVFWFHPDTGQAVIGPLRASVIYDLPVFLAYLSIIPGMAVFLTRMETDFVEYHERFYTTVREGGSLDELEGLRDEMVLIIRQGLGRDREDPGYRRAGRFRHGPGAAPRARDIGALSLAAPGAGHIRGPAGGAARHTQRVLLSRQARHRPAADHPPRRVQSARHARHPSIWARRITVMASPARCSARS
jgi:hypothetical protein